MLEWPIISVTIFLPLLGALIIFSWVFITSFVVLKVIDSIVGIRASEEDEELGLDKAEIGVEAYPDFK